MIKGSDASTCCQLEDSEDVWQNNVMEVIMHKTLSINKKEISVIM